MKPEIDQAAIAGRWFGAAFAKSIEGAAADPLPLNELVRGLTHQFKEASSGDRLSFLDGMMGEAVAVLRSKRSDQLIEPLGEPMFGPAAVQHVARAAKKSGLFDLVGEDALVGALSRYKPSFGPSREDLIQTVLSSVSIDEPSRKARMDALLDRDPLKPVDRSNSLETFAGADVCLAGNQAASRMKSMLGVGGSAKHKSPAP